MIIKSDSTKKKTLARRASELRAGMAIELANGGHRSQRSGKGHCHFSLYGDVLPIESPQEAISFNRDVTSRTLSEHVLRSDDPFEVAYLGAEVVEACFQCIYASQQPKKPHKNLSVAKHFGTFFTSPVVASRMYAEIPRDLSKKVLLDPCVGSGALLCASLLSSERNRYISLRGVELDAQMADWARQIISRVAYLTGFGGSIDITTGDGLALLTADNEIAGARATDIIINPPYGRLRLTGDRASNLETALRSGKQDPQRFAGIQSSVIKEAAALKTDAMFAGERGIIEKSRLFFRACAAWAASGSSVSIISPDSWMSGKDGAVLRKSLLKERLISKVLLIAETDGDFKTVNQSTAITVLTNEDRDEFEIYRMNGAVVPVGVVNFSNKLKSADDDIGISRVVGSGQALYDRLSGYRKLAEQDWLVNARGEVDQTAQKHLFRERETKIKLARGEHIQPFQFWHTSSDKKPSFISPQEFPAFIKGKPKEKHFNAPRIIGRQCSYAQQPRRLMFCSIDPKVCVGNSCNYIHVIAATPEEREQTTNVLLGVLNSALLDWYFRVGNSNNHVANYEIDGLPFPSEEKWIGAVASVSALLQMQGVGEHGWIKDLLEAAVFLAYGVSDDEDLTTVLDSVGVVDRSRVLNYVRQLRRGVRLDFPARSGRWFNHKEPALSALDKEVISHVPEGGNWQNIPASVPSERLRQIREMTAERGVVRTTYYGRLRRNQPAYTINTYFNRPGNGTHIHPSLDRTLTSREAARLQSFPDSYIFLGTEGAVRNQIGNAVPPLLAKAIGEKIIASADGRLCVDVFCGAGGLSLGLERAGWHVVAAIDNDAHALDTYSFNRPCDIEPESPHGDRTAVYKADLHDAEAFQDVVTRVRRGLDGRELDLLVGGPPCQGFSHAGFRIQTDARNDLASIYLHFVEQLRPKVFLLENVEGLATFKGGQVVRDIAKTLKSLGYTLHEPIWRLSAEEYGAPQMRKRVFIVATRDQGACLTPPEPSFDRCHGRRETGEMSSRSSGRKHYHSVADALAGLSLPQKESELMGWLLS